MNASTWQDWRECVRDRGILIPVTITQDLTILTGTAIFVLLLHYTLASNRRTSKSAAGIAETADCLCISAASIAAVLSKTRVCLAFDLTAPCRMQTSPTRFYLRRAAPSFGTPADTCCLALDGARPTRFGW